VPTILEIIFTLSIISVLYPYQFTALCGGVVIIYFFATISITEWRAKFFKSQA
jgi:ABC-type transport system involved in Fe-S cluster assembly fused permease/ATPase subunit